MGLILVVTALRKGTVKSCYLYSGFGAIYERGFLRSWSETYLLLVHLAMIHVGLINCSKWLSLYIQDPYSFCVRLDTADQILIIS